MISSSFEDGKKLTVVILFSWFQLPWPSITPRTMIIDRSEKFKNYLKTISSNKVRCGSGPDKTKTISYLVCRSFFLNRDKIPILVIVRLLVFDNSPVRLSCGSSGTQQ